MYAIYHGESGITNIANNIHRLTEKLTWCVFNDIEVMNDTYFDTVTFKHPWIGFKTIFMKTDCLYLEMRTKYQFT